MPVYRYPFIRLQLRDGSLEHRSYARLPLLIRNPANGMSVCTVGLVDTGADTILFPALLTTRLGHSLKGAGVKTAVTSGIEQTDIIAYRHTFEVHLLAPNMRRSVWTATLEVDCVETNPPLLLGVEDFLRHFRVTLDYPAETVRLAW